jgi:hypothetical protein
MNPMPPDSPKRVGSSYGSPVTGSTTPAARRALAIVAVSGWTPPKRS